MLIQYSISYSLHRYEIKEKEILGQPCERIPIPQTPRACSPEFPRAKQLEEESEKKEKKPKVMLMTIDEERTVDTPAVQQDTKAPQVSRKLNTDLVLLSLLFTCNMLSLERVNFSVHVLSLRDG